MPAKISLEKSDEYFVSDKIFHWRCLLPSKFYADLFFYFFIFLIRQRFALVKLILKNKKISKQIKEIVKKTIYTSCPSVPVGCAWWLSRLIILLKVFSRFQRPINEKKKIFPFIKKLYPRWFLERFLVATKIEYFQLGHRSFEWFCNLAPDILF